jgi:hypothetical protein
VAHLRRCADGWETIFGEDGRQECLAFIEKNWTDMRTNSLIRQMEADAAARQGSVSGNGMSGNGSATAKKSNGSRASRTPKKEAVGEK